MLELMSACQIRNTMHLRQNKKKEGGEGRGGGRTDGFLAHPAGDKNAYHLPHVELKKNNKANSIMGSLCKSSHCRVILDILLCSGIPNIPVCILSVE